MRQKPHSTSLYTIHFTLYTKKQSFEIMKKVYMVPQTEAIELLGANAIMAGSGSYIPTGANVSGEYGD